MSSIYLTKNEIEEITHRSRFSAQIRALASMGIPYRVRPDGTPLVCRSAFEQIMGISPIIQKTDNLIDKPDFGAFDGP